MEVPDGDHEENKSRKNRTGVLGTVVALLVHLLPITNSFMILVITALLFFGIYGGGLLLMKEPLVYEVVGQMKEKFLKK